MREKEINENLKNAILNKWKDSGYSVSVNMEKRSVQDGGCYYSVRSNLINGLPRDLYFKIKGIK